jgi:hypothetical protein
LRRLLYDRFALSRTLEGENHMVREWRTKIQDGTGEWRDRDRGLKKYDSQEALKSGLHYSNGRKSVQPVKLEFDIVRQYLRRRRAHTPQFLTKYFE